MTMFSDSALGNFIRGGQTTLHYCRMVLQVIKKFTGISIVIALLTFLTILYFTTTKQDKIFIMDVSIAWFHNDLFDDGETIVNYHYSNGETRAISAKNLLSNSGVIQRIFYLKSKSYKAFIYTVFLWFTLLAVMAKFIFKAGRSQKKDEFLRGTLLVNTKKLKKQIKDFIIENDEKWGTFEFAGMKLPSKFEVQHFLVVGEPGTGKSVLIKDALQSIRKNKQRAFLYDRSGEFVANFYRPGIDIILNPFDERGANWDLFKECKSPHEFDTLASSFIPDAKASDPFWTNAPRILFSSLAQKESEKQNPSLKKLIDNILHLSLVEMIEVCEGTDAAAILSKGGEKMAISVRGVLVSFVRSLKFLKESKNGFSIKEWVKDDSGDGWIFITSNKSIHEVSKPLITTWIDTATNAILSLPPSFDRRIWGVVDELVTLNKLPSIRDTPAEVRKHGGAFIYGFQNYPQLVDIYGREGAAALTGSCSTLAIFRSTEDTFASWGSRQLGKAEVIETNEALSFGSNEIRDGVNLGKTRKERPIVMDSELQNLPDLHCFIRLGRGLPVAYHIQKFKKIPTIAEGFSPIKKVKENSSIDPFENEDEEKNLNSSNEFEEEKTIDKQAVDVDSSSTDKEEDYEFSIENKIENKPIQQDLIEQKETWKVDTSLHIKNDKNKINGSKDEKKSTTSTTKKKSKGLNAFRKKHVSENSEDDEETGSKVIPVDNDLTSFKENKPSEKKETNATLNIENDEMEI